MLITFVVTVLIAISANYTQQMSRISKRTRAIDTAMEIGDGCLEMLFANWRNIYRSETATFLPTNYFYTNVYHPNSQPTITPVPALIPTPPPSAFPSAANYPGCITKYQIVATDPMLAQLPDPYPTSSPPPAGYGPGSNQYSYYYLASADVTVPALGASGTVTAKVRRVFEKKLNTPWSWGIFYNDLLEITPGTALSLTGAIHTNNSLYTGSNNLTITNTNLNSVSILGTLGYVGAWTVGYAPGDTYHVSAPTAPNYPDGQPPAQENNFLPFGWNVGQIFNITDTNGNNDGYREIVEVPASSGTDPLKDQRYYNQAYVRIIIDSTGAVKYYDNSGPPNYTATQCTASTGTTTQKQIYTTLNSALAKNESFTDAREGSTVTISTLDVSKITSDVNSNKLPNFNGVIYFSDQRASQTGGTPKNGLRLKNGSSLPTTTSNGVTPGLTVATDNPVYIQGDFNTGGTPPSDSSSNPDPTQPTAGGYTRQPASIVSDAVTLLSNSWLDTNSSKAISSRLASNTTVNAAIVAGDVPTGTSNGNYSGGAENLVRLLEDWTGKHFTYYGGLTELYHSRQGVGLWGSANVYNPPTLHFYYDSNFQTASPPGNLVLASYLQQQRWYLVY
ncbi:MAG: hypothetical protein ABR514_06875 [Chthoniobacterales bacterium]